MSAAADDVSWMAHALQLAAKGLYTTQPNPRVGCVIVRDGVMVGEGYHQRAGEPHAEVHALRMAGELARGATAYVTLEPCAHHGRTPPCADALIAAGVGRVVAACTDSNPQVAGKGLERIRAAGIDTAVGVLEAEAKALNAGFLRRIAGGLPWVRVKSAASLDGRTAMASGESKWITGPAARADVQKWRARSGAIITGVDTVLADDAQMTVRPEMWADWHHGVPVQPMRVVLDSQLRFPVDVAMLKAPGRTVLMTLAPQADSERANALRAAGAEIVAVAAQNGRPDLRAVLEWLKQQQVNEVLVEAGATVSGAFVQAGLVDEMVLYLAPTLLGSDARALFDLPLLKMSEQKRVKIRDVRQVGDDLRIIAGMVGVAGMES